jgi:hypothetical protein
MTSAAVYGTGSWGTAYASVLADAGTSVTMWGRRQEVVDQINAGTNEDYLPELRLPSTIRATTDPFEAAAGADIVVLAVPSQTLRANLEVWGIGAPVVGGDRLAHEGGRAGDDPTDVRGDLGGRWGRAGASRHRVRAEPGPRDRRQAACGLGRRVVEPGDGRALSPLPARRRTSGPTPAPTSSEPRSAAR